MADHDPYCQWPRIPCQCADFAAARADAIAEIQEKHHYEDARRLAELRAKVEELPSGVRWASDVVRRADVLALIDGSSE